MGQGIDKDALSSIRAVVKEELRLALDKAGVPVPEGAGGRLLEGDVKYFRLPEVLQLVSLQRLTGRLAMWHERQSVDIYMRRGQVAFATDEKRGSGEQLGHILLNMGRISRASLEGALEQCAKNGVRLGKALIEGGHVGPEDIKAVLLRQTERSVYRAMAWGDGRFAFEFCEMPDFVEDIPVSLRVEDLILEGVRRIEEGRLIAEKIPNLDIVFIKPAYSSEEVDGMRLKAGERTVLDLIDGSLDLRGMIEKSGMAEFNFLRAACALYSAGIIKKREPAQRTGKTQYL